MLDLFIFTYCRLHLNKIKLDKSRAYLALPIILYNIYCLYTSKKKLTESDNNQKTSTNLMLSMFLSDLILFKNRNISDFSLIFHHFFCSLSYIISSFTGTPKIYTLMSIPELMILGKLINRKYRDIYYIFIIFFRLPFWYKLFKIYKDFDNIIKYNAFFASLIMPGLDIFWLIEIFNKIKKNNDF